MIQNRSPVQLCSATSLANLSARGPWALQNSHRQDVPGGFHVRTRFSEREQQCFSLRPDPQKHGALRDFPDPAIERTSSLWRRTDLRSPTPAREASRISPIPAPKTLTES